MTTPQNVLQSIEYNLRQLLKLMNGEYSEDEDEGPIDIYEMCKSIEIEVTEFNERLDILDDKMNIIIKLLGKCG